MTNRHRTVLYTGVTSGLMHRVGHNVDKLVWFEAHADVLAAIAREKPIKAGSRTKNIVLIEAFKPAWRDLYQAWE